MIVKNEVKVSGEVLSRPTAYISKNGATICQFTLKIPRLFGAGATHIPCALYGADAETFYNAVDIGANIGIEGELRSYDGIQIAGTQFVVLDEKTKRAYNSYVSAKLSGHDGRRIKNIDDLHNGARVPKKARVASV